MKTPPLYLLPNGSWIDPRTVTSIRPLAAKAGMMGEAKWPERVKVTAIESDTITTTVFDCGSRDEALELAGRLAQEINLLRQEP